MDAVVPAPVDVDTRRTQRVDDDVFDVDASCPPKCEQTTANRIAADASDDARRDVHEGRHDCGVGGVAAEALTRLPSGVVETELV